MGKHLLMVNHYTGGSTILLLFEPGVLTFDEDLTENSGGALETLVSLDIWERRFDVC